MIHLIDTSANPKGLVGFPSFTVLNPWMGDKRSDRMEVGERAVNFTLDLTSTSQVKSSGLDRKRGKLLWPSSPNIGKLVPIRGIHTGDSMYVKGVQDSEENVNSLNSESNKSSGFSWNRRDLNVEVLFLNKERKQLNKKINSLKNISKSNKRIRQTWIIKDLRPKIERLLSREQYLIATLADRQEKEAVDWCLKRIDGLVRSSCFIGLVIDNLRRKRSRNTFGVYNLRISDEISYEDCAELLRVIDYK